MGEVVDLDSRRSLGNDQFVMKCECGSDKYYLVADGTAECVECGTIPQNITLNIDFDN